MPQITSVEVVDVRFPTSLTADGSDAMNKDGDYSAAYVVLSTDSDLQGFGLTFTIGRGNELCVAAARSRRPPRRSRCRRDGRRHGRPLPRSESDSQFRWLGPEKGVVHLSMAAVLNAAGT